MYQKNTCKESISTVISYIISRMKQNAKLSSSDVRKVFEGFLNERTILFGLHPDRIGGKGEEIKVFNGIKDEMKKSGWSFYF